MRCVKLNPLFSIIIPAFNAEKYIKKCIESIVNQSFCDYEAIIVDDGSLDETSKICDDFSKEYNAIKVVHKNNGGVVLARQTGVNVSTGEYIVFVDADDYLSSDYLEEFNSIIQSWHPDVVCCNYFNLSNGHTVIARMQYESGFYDRKKMINNIFPSLIVSNTGKGFAPQLWAKAFKRSIYKQHQLVDTVVKMGEDVACSKPAIANSFSLFISDKALYFYRDNPDSITKSKILLPWDGPLKRGEHLFKHTQVFDFDFSDQIYRDIVLSLFTVARSRFNKQKKSLDVKQEISKQLDFEFYKNAIVKASFSNIKLKIIHYSLKHRCFWFMKLYNRIKKE